MKVQIITIVTGDYKNYFEMFYNTLRYFMPDDNKLITVLTDDAEMTRGIENVKTIVIPNMLYPTVNVNKMFFCKQFMDNSADAIFFFDIDTLFLEKDYKWDDFKSHIENGEVFLTSHPFYVLQHDATIWGGSKDSMVENLYTSNLTEKDPRFACFIDDAKYCYINSAFFGARTDVFSDFVDAIVELEKKDLQKYPNGYHIPMYIDENYVNKLVNLHEHGEMDKFKFNIRSFNMLYDCDNIKIDSVFMYQKNINPDIKRQYRHE